MKTTDVELINRILNGDETAFTELVEKYQKPVHALVWRKIEDFHIAEEITQDIFLKAYQKLDTLKKPQRFASWLYVIASRHCLAWLRKKRIRTQPLEETNSLQVEKATYSQYVIEENEKTTAITQREVVKKLLAKLPESERTVITLHYFSDMSSAEIGAFLGVSANTIRSRLRRAQQRLQKEETMIREALDHFQISPNLTDNVMREISRIKPTAPSGSKPFVPWIIGATSAILIVLMLGIGSQYLAHFQKPYSLDAQTETTVKLIDTPVVLNLEAKPDVQNRLGNPNIIGPGNNNGQKPDEVLLSAAQADGEDVSVPKQQWIQSKAVSATSAIDLCTTPAGDLYVLTKYHTFNKLSTGSKTWKRVHNVDNTNTDWGSVRSVNEWRNTLYFVTDSELFTSVDDGETWNSLYSWKGEEYEFPFELVLTEEAFYLAFKNSIIRSIDYGKSWERITNGLPEFDGAAKAIGSFIETQNTLFALTHNGLYCLKGNIWVRLITPKTVGRVRSIAATEGKLYVYARWSSEASQELKRYWGIFRSNDFGNSWKDITPKNAWHNTRHSNGFLPNIKLIAVGETLLAMAEGMVRSTDGGDTWLSPQAPGTTPSMGMDSPVAVVNEDVIYVGSWDGLYYSTNLGESWHMNNIWQKGGSIYDLIAIKKNIKGQHTPASLYARVIRSLIRGADIKRTDDSGNSWNNVPIAMTMTTPGPKLQPYITQIVKYGDALYAKAWHNITLETRIYCVSSDGRTTTPIQEMPVFSSKKLAFYGGELTDHFTFLEDQVAKGLAFGATQFFKELAQPQFRQRGDRDLIWPGLSGAFAVDNNTFYMEYNFKLFRWKQGETEWHDTGLEETVELSKDILRKNLKLAVSGDTVCVGKRDGSLIISFDAGNNWVDLTPALPFPIKTFKEIIFAGSKVYIATDVGILASDNGRNWRIVTDTEGYKSRYGAFGS